MFIMELVIEVSRYDTLFTYRSFQRMNVTHLLEQAIIRNTHLLNIKNINQLKAKMFIVAVKCKPITVNLCKFDYPVSTLNTF